ncbi:MAG: hypothetical protein L0Z71_04080 [Anaerolineae bacterium]|nr:hypothetical protein [Anaerolineae bacterium]
MNEKHHEMILQETHTSGVEEWYCPTCARRFLVQWPPSYKIIILEAGDQDTRHSLSMGNLRIGPFQVTQAEGTGLNEDFRLIPWMKWFEKVDFDSGWGKNA